MTVTRRQVIAGGLAALAISGQPAAAVSGIPGSRRIAFDVWRRGDKIGFHTLEFSGDDQNFSIMIKVELVVRIAFIPVFRYEHQNVETWKDGKLESCKASTDDNGRKRIVTAVRQDDAIDVDGTLSGKYKAPSEALIATHWNRRELDVPMINPETGTLLHPTVTDEGETQIQHANGSQSMARKYALSGLEGPQKDLVLWYDNSDQWAALSFTAQDGSEVHYRKA